MALAAIILNTLESGGGGGGGGTILSWLGVAKANKHILWILAVVLARKIVC